MLFLFSSNFDEFTENILFVPIILFLAFAAVLYGLILIIFRSAERAAIITSFITIFSLSYARLLEPLKGLRIGSIKLDQEQGVMIVIVLVISIIIYLTYRFKNNLIFLNKALTFISVFLVGFTLISLISSEIRTGRLFKSPITSSFIQTNTKGTTNENPDIYYFIFDRYGADKMFKEQYGYDNSQFTNFLKDKGFYIARDSTTNYPKTFLSLASSLNMEYVNYLTEKTNGGKSTDQSLITPLTQNNKVLKYLKGKGYSYIHMGSWWTPTASNPNADKNYIMPNSLYFGADEFTSGLLNTTIASSVLKELSKSPIDVSVNPRDNDHRRRIFYEFGQIDEISKIKGPKFVFIHILVPHDPFVVDKNCQPISEKIVSKNTHQINYIAQIQCANKHIEKTLTTILKNSKKSPVIIFQADEGPFPMNSSLSKDQAWKNVDDQALHEKFPILNAYYLPGKKDTQLYQSITPVNSFRVILNEYFGEKFQLLEDKNYVFEDEQHYYKFLDVTDRVK